MNWEMRNFLYCVHVFPRGFTVPATSLVISGTRLRKSPRASFEVWSGQLPNSQNEWVKAHRTSVPCPPGWSRVTS